MLALAGCGKFDLGLDTSILTAEPNYGAYCPRVAVLDGPGELTRFAPGGEGALDQVVFSARMRRIDHYCYIHKKKTDIVTTLMFDVIRGPANTAGLAPFFYFVAVLDRDGNVLTRNRFPLTVEYHETETLITFTEDFTATILRVPDHAPPEYRVYVGFEMSSEDLAYSRNRLRKISGGN